jgi:hypothetical protein
MKYMVLKKEANNLNADKMLQSTHEYVYLIIVVLYLLHVKSVQVPGYI